MYTANHAGIVFLPPGREKECNRIRKAAIHVCEDQLRSNPLVQFLRMTQPFRPPNSPPKQSIRRTPHLHVLGIHIWHSIPKSSARDQPPPSPLFPSLLPPCQHPQPPPISPVLLHPSVLANHKQRSET